MNEIVQRSGKATASLVLGILSFCLTFLAGLPAIILGILALMDIGKSEGKTGGQGMAIAGIVTGAIGGFMCFPIMLALLLPAVQAARAAAWKSQCAMNLKQIGIALQNYEATTGSLPPALIADANGTPMHSWRMLLTPYLERNDVHEAYDFNQPWNGAANSALAQSRPVIFACPANEETGGTATSYVVVTGPGFAFEGGKSANSRMAVGGLSHTIAVVDLADSGIEWTEPRDVTFEEFVARLQSGSVCHRGGFNALLLDGSVVFFDSEKMDTEELRALFALANDGGVAF